MGEIVSVSLGNRDLQWFMIVVMTGVFIVILAYRFERNHLRRGQENQEIRWMKTIAENVMDLILILDEKGKVQYITPSITRFLGYRDQEIKGKAILDYIHPEDKDTVLKRFQQGREDHRKIEGRFLHKDGYYVYLSAQVKHLYDGKGESTGAVISCQDITERKRTENRLRSLRFKDVLTGLYNRGYFEEQVPKYLEKENYPLSIIVGDIDDLKKINDNYGHLRGDWILGVVGRVLKNNCRKGDLVCRIGGDEFVMLLPKTQEKEVEIVMARIEKEAASLGKKGVNCGISLGSHTVMDPVGSIEEAMEKADRNMYRRKSERKKAV
ncbi:sensor domain-containing diguanylate cyclase [Isachenkonia alkalipeptolytica]|uniref:Diguanylate cyclase n=1 Tax=Isachenkonia alkalipeptolytica TaxID=2565777 RepID=A0AA44BFB0_9CLOT|nr:GGDEF domain-containing protein [Isachenkonia alkalipeptolytica]NBG88361.1 diguanylate cyclase [Isachenkonia alkalipeptolytica]